MRIRPISQKKYEISKHRFYELYHLCLQYQEWKDELKYNLTTQGSSPADGMPKGNKVRFDQMEKMAIKRAELEHKCRMIEEAAEEADPVLKDYILKAVTNEGISYNYLEQKMNIPCGKTMFYDRRRKFFWILSKKIN